MECKGGMYVKEPHHLFNEINNKTKLNPFDIFQIADSLKGANFQDEQTVRNLVQQLSQLVQIPIEKDKEDEIVNAIVNNHVPNDLSSLMDMFKTNG